MTRGVCCVVCGKNGTCDGATYPSPFTHASAVKGVRPWRGPTFLVCSSECADALPEWHAWWLAEGRPEWFDVHVKRSRPAFRRGGRPRGDAEARP